MVIRTEIFCQVIPEKNQAENANPLKKSKKHQILCMFTNLYPFLIRLCRPQEVIPKLMKHILSNVPHLLSPQQALEVSQTHILGAISCYFATGIMKDPVYIVFEEETLSNFSFKCNFVGWGSTCIKAKTSPWSADYDVVENAILLTF